MPDAASMRTHSPRTCLAIVGRVGLRSLSVSQKRTSHLRNRCRAGPSVAHGCVVRTAHGPRRDPRAGAPSAFAPRTARCPLAADPGCNLPGQRSFLARWQMVAKPARRRSPRRHQQRRRRRSSSHSASRAVRLPHAAPIGLLHCTSGATMCTCSSMPMPRVPCADALDEPAHVPQMPSVQVTVGSPEAERRGPGVAPTAHGA